MRLTFVPGAPCRVDTFQPDPAAAARFYGALLGWRFDDGDSLARLGGRVVAGFAQALPGLPSAVWSTSVAVEELDAAVAKCLALGAAVAVPPAAALGGRLAILTDPTRVAFGVWEGPGLEVAGEPGAWALSALHSPDPAAAAAFYGAAFGWRAEPLPGGAAPLQVLRLEGAVGAPERGVPDDAVGVLAPTAPGVPPHWAVSFRVEDVDATAARAVELGATLVVAPLDAAGQRTAAIADPQGGVIALVAPLT
jgi:uncharacterized protein